MIYMYGFRRINDIYCFSRIYIYIVSGGYIDIYV